MYLYIETLKQRLDAINQLRVDRALAAMGPATLPKKEAAVEHLAVIGSPAMQEVRHGDQL